MLDATNGMVTYGGIEIVDSGSLNTRINAKFVLDDAARTLKWVEYEINIKGYVTLSGLSQGDPTTDITLAAMRDVLSGPGQALVFKAKGYGDLVVNLGSSPQDANWGPIPQVLQWVPIGDDQTAAVEFRVICHVPACPHNVPRFTKSIMAFGWGVAYSMDSDGYTSVNISGYIEIPMTRVAGSNVAPDTVDAYRDKCFPVPIIGFRRESFEFKVANNHRRAEFSARDVQLAKPLPPNCTICDFDHVVTFGTGFAMATASLSGTLRIAAGQPTSLGYQTFQSIVSQRLLNGGTTIRPFIQAPQQPSGPGAVLPFVQVRPVILPSEYQFGEQVFGKDLRFSVKYKLLFSGSDRLSQGSRLNLILSTSRLWTLFKDFTHNKWYMSMKLAQVLSSRSVAALKLLPTDDILVDLCTPASGSTTKGGTGPPIPTITSGGGGGGGGGQSSGSGNSSGARIPPSQSWTYYDASTVLDQESGAIFHKPLAGKVVEEIPTLIQVTNPQQAAAATIAPGSDLITTQRDIPQDVNLPTIYLRLIGRASRLQYPVDPPQLVQVGGVPAVEVSRKIAVGVSQYYIDIPENYCMWNILYRLLAPVDTIPTIANPYLGSPGNLQ